MARKIKAWVVVVAIVGTVSALGLVKAAEGASSPTVTYSAIETVPVPPASNYAGSGGGDGWAVALSATSVYNVFHHQSTLQVACHLQADASSCWDPETITDASGNNFATSGQPGLFLSQATGKLYVFATRTSDQTGGVVCIDTTIAATNTDPFCGFTALTAVGDAPQTGGISAISDPAIVGGKWYAFNYAEGSTVTGTQNKLLCFDLTTLAACANQPFALTLGGSATDTVGDGDYPPPAVAGIGQQVIVPIDVGSSRELACFDASASANCTGSWPVDISSTNYFDSSSGAPFPLLTSTGTVNGLCLPDGTDECFTLAGASVATPTGMTTAIDANSGWDGPGAVVGPRVYVPNGLDNQVDCYDYSASSGCANFPKSLSDLGLLYTVNPDPQRPTCLWVNSDDGSEQIQNFDAFTGGACGSGGIRVLASSLVAPAIQCVPLNYSSLQILAPPPSAYSGGSVNFEDSDGNPIANTSVEPLDATGTVSLSGLNLGTGVGLPQFVITLNGVQGQPSSVEVKLTWTGVEDPTCAPIGAPTVSTSLSGGGQSGVTITVPASTAVTDTATLAGPNVSTAGGTVTYSVFSDASCTVSAGSGGTVNVTNGSVPASSAVTLSTPGTYYWQASYSGDGANNQPSFSPCGTETETVQGSQPPPPTVSTSLSGGGQSGVTITVPASTAVTDTATLAGPNVSTAGGTVTYSVFSDASCTVSAGSGGTVNVTNGSVPASNAVTLSTLGTYYWQASYTASAGVAAVNSACGSETETVATASSMSPTSLKTHLSAQSSNSCPSNGKSDGDSCGSDGHRKAGHDDCGGSGWSGRSGRGDGCFKGKDSTLKVMSGTAVTDSAVLKGADVSTASGTVTYSVFSDSACTVSAGSGGTVNVTSGSVPDSSAVTLSTPGTYYWQASYSGDTANGSSTSKCGSEVEVVTTPSTQLSTQLSAPGATPRPWGMWSANATTVDPSTPVTDSATLTGVNAARATGTVTYSVYQFSGQGWSSAADGGTVTVTGGTVPNSNAVTLGPGVYMWQATYSGDAMNGPSMSPFASEVEVVVSPPPACQSGWGWLSVACFAQHSGCSGNNHCSGGNGNGGGGNGNGGGGNGNGGGGNYGSGRSGNGGRGNNNG